jgi:multimeric flavodoxin WrbA
VSNEFQVRNITAAYFPDQGGRDMKILTIMGSPKGKGSGYRIVRMIEDRMRAMGDVEFEYLFLKDANLRPCTGCYTCLAKGEDECPLKDDRAPIEQKLLTSDGVILSSPMYVLNVSWLMKNFIDRFAYANHRPRFHRQKVLSVVNMGGDNPKTTLSFLRNALGGSRIVHELGIATPPWLQTERAVEMKERAIAGAAKKFYRACLDTSLPSPTLHSLILFHIRQKAFLECRQYLPADYAFYNGKAYYYDTNINPIKAAMSKVIVGVMMNRRKDMGPGNIPWPVAKKEE